MKIADIISAAQNNRLKELKLTQDELNQALISACKKQSPAVIDALLTAGANPEVEIENLYDWTLLHLLVKAEQIEKVQVFLRHHANIHARTRARAFTLEEMQEKAGKFGMFQFTTHQKSSGVSCTLNHDKYSETPLVVAVNALNYKLAEILLLAGSDPNATNYSGQSCLHYAAERGDEALFDLLIKHKAILDLVDKKKMNVLHAATKAKNINLVNKILATRFNPNLTDDLGDTPLHYAVITGEIAIAETLLLHGAENTLNRRELSPLKRALRQSNGPLFDLLVTHFGMDEVNNSALTLLDSHNKSSVCPLIETAMFNKSRLPNIEWLLSIVALGDYIYSNFRAPHHISLKQLHKLILSNKLEDLIDYLSKHQKHKIPVNFTSAEYGSITHYLAKSCNAENQKQIAEAMTLLKKHYSVNIYLLNKDKRHPYQTKDLEKYDVYQHFFTNSFHLQFNSLLENNREIIEGILSGRLIQTHSIEAHYHNPINLQTYKKMLPPEEQSLLLQLCVERIVDFEKVQQHPLAENMLAVFENTEGQPKAKRVVLTVQQSEQLEKLILNLQTLFTNMLASVSETPIPTQSKIIFSKEFSSFLKTRKAKELDTDCLIDDSWQPVSNSR